MNTNKNLDVLETENFFLHGRLSAPAHFVEGFTQVSFGSSFAKILFHNVIEHKTAESRESRKAEQYLTMPTMQAIELAHLLLLTAKHAQAHVMAGLNAGDKEKLRAMLNDFQSGTAADSPPPDKTVPD